MCARAEPVARHPLPARRGPAVGGRFRRLAPWLICAALTGGAALPAGAGTASTAGVLDPPYESLPEAKALAVAPSRPDTIRAITQGQANDLAASIAARERCQASAGANEACEIVRLNDEWITTGREIRSRVPPDPHPLFLWRYQQAQRVVYLAGSIHILKPSLYPLPAQFDAAFERADSLVLEVDLASLAPTELQRRSLEYALLTPPDTLRDVVPAPLYQRLRTHLAAYGTSPEALANAKPAMVMNQIVVSRLLTLGYLPDSGLESYFLDRRSGQRVLALETLDEQLDLLFNQPMPTQLELLAETLDMEAHIEPLLAGMLVAWLAGDDATFLEAFTAQSGDSEAARAFSRQLLDERNHRMVEGIRRFLDDPAGGAHTYFVLVGAAHLVGDQGIVSLLARSGQRGQRILSDTIVGAESNSGPAARTPQSSTEPLEVAP